MDCIQLCCGQYHEDAGALACGCGLSYVYAHGFLMERIKDVMSSHECWLSHVVGLHGFLACFLRACLSSH